MEIKPWRAIKPASADLSRAPRFSLGMLEVDPSTCRVRAGTKSEKLEPRVMRVLVALGESPGQVHSRDDLLSMCWDGQIVSDNAINRVISLLRKVLEEFGCGSVKLENITKVGFRIVVDKDAGAPRLDRTKEPANAVARNGWTRRTATGGMLAISAASAVTFVAWQRSGSHVPDPKAVDLYRRGQLLQKTGELGTMRQAMSFYEQAVTIDPQYADAWGALAIGYRHGGDGFVKGPREAYLRLTRSAALRALALNPDQPDAHMALLSITSEFGHWLDREVQLRALVRRFPNYWYALARLDLLLQDVGRFDEAIAARQRQLALEPTIPFAWSMYVRALHFAGRDHEAEIALDQSFAKWPANAFLWLSRYSILIGGGRFVEGAAFARDPRSLPEALSGSEAAMFVEIADALADGPGRRKAAGRLTRSASIASDSIPFIAPLLFQLGAFDAAFACIEAFYFGGILNGKEVSPPDATTSRETALLFAPAVLEHRNNSRYVTLLERTGLERYWRLSGTRPDCRRA